MSDLTTLEEKAQNKGKKITGYKLLDDASLEKNLNNFVFGKNSKKVKIGFSVVGWGVFGILAYNFWNKSNNWKLIISVFGAYNLYNNYMSFNKLNVKEIDGSNLEIETETETKTESEANTGTYTSYGTRPSVPTIPPTQI
jgi:hypothetical protein